jgi:CRISPR-associated protein Cmr3
MTVWIIEPQDPLLVRDGRPFGANPGVRARSLPFPFPSTTTGAVRTRAGQDPHGRFDPTTVSAVTAIRTRGPLLLEEDDDGHWAYLAPAPRDALAFDGPGDTLTVRPLTPLLPSPGALSDLDAVPNQPPLHPIGLTVTELAKPAKDAPAFWRWAQFQDWLAKPSLQQIAAAELGLPALSVDRRMHVAIDPTTGTGRDGMLFMTGGLAFHHNPDPDDPQLSGTRRLALAVAVDNETDPTHSPGWGPMGGERRLMVWRPDGPALPPLPAALRQSIITARRCRIILLTPAAFNDGWRPAWLLQPRHDVTPTLEAAAVGKPDTVSGWDLALGRLKASRRLAPAGSVYYLTLTGPGDIGRWLDDVWLHCVSDESADRDAGFGLAAVGAYDGPQTMISEEAHHAQQTT